MNVYDFDDTIYNGDSSKDFFLFCIKKHPIICLILPRFAFYVFIYMIGKCSKEKMKESYFNFLRYLPNTEVEVTLFWEKNFHKIFDWYIKQKQNTDVIISASPEFLLKPVCDKLGVTLIASIVDPQSGLYTGINCHSAEKVKRFTGLYPDVQINEFYSDSETDKPMALLAKSAFFVNNGVVRKWELS